MIKPKKKTCTAMEKTDSSVLSGVSSEWRCGSGVNGSRKGLALGCRSEMLVRKSGRTRPVHISK